MTFALTATDRKRLQGLHPDLLAIMHLTARICPFRFRVIQGARTVQQQRENVAKGVSWTMNSRHIPDSLGMVYAVDIGPYVDLDGDGKIVIDEIYHVKKMQELSLYVKAAAKQVGVKLEWGGDWRNTKDPAHYQLGWKLYPADTRTTPANITAAPPVEWETEAKAFVESRTVAGAVATKAASITTVINAGQDLVDKLSSVQPVFDGGSAILITIGIIGVIGSIAAIYSRWDDAGRPGFKELFDAAMNR